MRKPLVLTILDGWGIREESKDNAIKLAKTPNFDIINATYPQSKLDASGEAVGLPDGQMGNSEVGHLNIGAGRVVYQELTRINKEIREGGFFKNPDILGFIKSIKDKNGALHLYGLVSDGGVHSHIDHLVALLKFAQEQGIKTYVHAILDGRDVPPQSAKPYLEKLVAATKQYPVAKIASVAGRYWSMDRDNRWDRVEKGYKAMTDTTLPADKDVLQVLDDSYKINIVDEFLEPTKLLAGAEGAISDGDGVFCFNFRPDRVREMTQALALSDFTHFERKQLNISYLCMTQYNAKFNLPVVYKPISMDNILAQILSEKNLKQYHTAETEKYPHVTFFFNGGTEKSYQGEERLVIPSPQVATYDMQPEMSVYPVADNVVNLIKNDEYDVYIINIANGDMVGHTGVLDAAIKAVEAVDEAVGKIYRAVLEAGGTMLISADHGNCEQMWDYENNQPHTQHTCNLVPFILISNEQKYTLSDGILADIAPTMLELLKIEKPKEMTGKSLLQPILAKV